VRLVEEEPALRIWMSEGECLSLPPAGSWWSENGWVAYLAAAVSDIGAAVFLRFGPRSGPGFEAGRLHEVRELHVASTHRQAVTAQLLRTVPIARAEAAINRSSEQIPDANWAGFGDPPDRGKPPAAFRWPEGGAWLERPKAPRGVAAPGLRLPEVDSFRKPDSFYRMVADRYQWLTANGHRPGPELAEANGIPVSTVHRWVREARRRGLMGAGQRAEGAEEQ
jgi:hypothetical protein